MGLVLMIQEDDSPRNCANQNKKVALLKLLLSAHLALSGCSWARTQDSWTLISIVRTNTSTPTELCLGVNDKSYYEPGIAGACKAARNERIQARFGFVG